MVHVVTAAIDKALEAEATTRHSSRIGGGLIGEECERNIWYTFHWITEPETFKGRMLRLFDRGHKEEFRIVEWLEKAGIRCEDYDTSTTHLPKEKWKQWAVTELEGHVFGYLDSKLYNVPGVEKYGVSPGEAILGEYKTHNDKSFKDLVKKGVYRSKPKHWHQTMLYMHLAKLKVCLYIAVNKNDDDIYCEFIKYDAMSGEALISKARDIISTDTPPPKISNSPSWFGCRFCKHRDFCHKITDIQPLKNCRNCSHSVPIKGGNWGCRLYNKPIPKDFLVVGCDNYKVMENLE